MVRRGSTRTGRPRRSFARSSLDGHPILIGSDNLDGGSIDGKPARIDDITVEGSPAKERDDDRAVVVGIDPGATRDEALGAGGHRRPTERDGTENDLAFLVGLSFEEKRREAFLDDEDVRTFDRVRLFSLKHRAVGDAHANGPASLEPQGPVDGLTSPERDGQIGPADQVALTCLQIVHGGSKTGDRRETFVVRGGAPRGPETRSRNEHDRSACRLAVRIFDADIEAAQTLELERERLLAGKDAGAMNRLETSHGHTHRERR